MGREEETKMLRNVGEREKEMGGGILLKWRLIETERGVRVEMKGDTGG